MQALSSYKSKEPKKPGQRIYSTASLQTRADRQGGFTGPYGAATAALDFTAWLGSVGGSAAYVEFNWSGIIPCLSEAYEMDEEAGGFRQVQ